MPDELRKAAMSGRQRAIDVKAGRSATATSGASGINATMRAYAELKARILNNELAPGSSHLEQDLASLLDMSRTPVREALIRLAEERLVEIRPRHGVRILPISLKDMADIYDLLTELEAHAARRAAEHGLTKGELARLDAAVAAMDQSLEADDLDAWSKADSDFHELLIAASRNERLTNAVKLFLDQVHRARQFTLHIRPKPVASNDDHRAVVAAIKARDPDNAHRIHHSHRARAGRLLLDLLAASEKKEF